MMARQHADSDYARLKAVYRRLIKLCGGYCAAAEITRVGKSKLHDYGNAHRPEFAPIDVVADLEAAAEQPLVSAELRHLNTEITCMAKPITDGEVHGLGVRVLSEVAAFERNAVEALENDGEIDDDELAQLIDDAEKIRAAARHASVALRRAQEVRRERETGVDVILDLRREVMEGKAS